MECIYITQINRYINKKRENFDKKNLLMILFMYSLLSYTYKYILYSTLKKKEKKKLSYTYIHKNIACSNINENDR